MERKTVSEILVMAKDIENYHNLNRANKLPIFYAEGAKYYSLF